MNGERSSQDVESTHVGVENSKGVTRVPPDTGNMALHGAQPFKSSHYSDVLSNVSNFKIIESTLRGEWRGDTRLY